MRTALTFRWFAITALLAGCPNEDDPSGDDTNVSATEPGTSTTNPSSSSGNNESSDSSSTTENEEESGSSSGTPSDSCGEGRVCLGPPPLGWTGPVVIAKGDVAEALPDCSDPYPGNEITRLEGFVEPEDATCECSCSLNDGGCYMYTYNSTDANPTYCYQSYGYPMSDGCFQLPQPVNDGILQVQSYPSFGAAACDQQASETIPEIPWAAVVKGCTGGYSDEACDATDGICYNKPKEGFEQQICYIAQGEVPLCPPNTDFMERTIRYSAVQDDRDCTSCQCGQLNYCLDEYEYFTNNDCSGAAAGTVPNGVCQGGITAQAVNFDFSGVSCPIQSMAEPEGEATPLDPWTYCCSAPF